MKSTETHHDELIGWQRLELLANLPVLLNSSLDLTRVIERTLEQLKLHLDAEAATVFLLDSSGRELTFWALEGGGESSLKGQRIPAHEGIVGWVIDHQEGVFVKDAQNDPRFFRDVDRAVGFATRNLVCVPLTARGVRRLGAVQVLNRINAHTFEATDLRFVEQIAAQVALAIENATLVQSLEQRTKALETLDRRKNDVITMIVHEFRTPLNVIQTSADMLSSGMLKEPETQKKLAGTLMNGVQRLVRLVSEVRNLSLVQAEELETRPVLTGFNRAMKEVQRFYEGIIAKRSLALSVSVEPVDLCGEVDPVLFMIAIRNLINNAIRFTPDGGKITVAVRENLGMVECTVKDTGIGIAKDQQALIFEKFYEVVDVLQHSSGDLDFRSAGLGIGLSTVRAIALAHRGTISVESVEGKGSTFTLRLPRLQSGRSGG